MIWKILSLLLLFVGALPVLQVLQKLVDALQAGGSRHVGQVHLDGGAGPANEDVADQLRLDSDRSRDGGGRAGLLGFFK